MALTVVAAGVAAADTVHRRYPGLSPKRVTGVLVLAAVIAAGGATWVIAEVGHSGAKATWNDLPTSSEGG